MKVLVLGTRGFPGVQGGVETHCYNLNTRLAQKGCKIIVIGRKKYIGSEVINCNGVRLLPIDCPKGKYTEAFIHTLKGIIFLPRIKPDVVHIHSIGPSLFVPLARLLGMKVVVTHHGPDYMRKKWGLLAKMVLRLGEFCAAKFANEIICISENITREIECRYKRNVHIIPNGVEIPRNGQDTGILSSHGLARRKYILAVGRFVPEKGFHDLLDAFEKLNSNDYKLVIAGDADHQTAYSKNLKARAKLNPNIVLTGIIGGDILAEIYFNAALFVLPSFYEGLPIVLLEALSYGLSVIASDIPANREVCLEAERYFNPGNKDQLSEKISYWLSQGPLSGDAKEVQIEKIKQKYDWDQLADRVLSVYEKVCRE